MTTKAVQMGSGAPFCRPMPKPSTCRCLFGRPSAEELAASRSEALRFVELDVAEKSRKYDFDFQTGTPDSVAKRWEWLPVVTFKEDDKTPDAVPLTEAVTTASDRLQPPPVSESSQLSAVHCEDSPNVVVSLTGTADVAAPSPSPAEPIPATTDADTFVSSLRCRKRSGGKTMKDFYPVKKQRSLTSPVTIKDVDCMHSYSSCSSNDSASQP